MELHPPTVPGLFITGTSTEIGKTVIACLIADQLRREDIRVGVFKPIASGCIGEGTELVSEDALALADAARLERAVWQLDQINPVKYREALAPGAAIAPDPFGPEAGAPEWSLIDSALRKWEAQCDILLVEGIGGAMVPLDAPGEVGGMPVTVLDMMGAMGLPVVVVADDALGTLNHTALTCMAVRGRGLEVAGVVLNNFDGVMGDPSVHSNGAWIEAQNGVRVLATVPRVARWDARDIDPAMRVAIDATGFRELARAPGAGAGVIADEDPKGAMREEMRRRIASMDERAMEKASGAITRMIIEGEAFANARNVLVYYAMPEEVNLGAVCAVATASGRALCFPRMDWEARTMEAIRVHSLVHDVEVRRHGIPEPSGGEVVAPGEVDLVLAPGLAFDEAGGRLGRGAGYYDRYIGRARGEGRVFVMGVAFACQVLDEGRRLAVEAHDEAMDAIVTENGVVGPSGTG